MRVGELHAGATRMFVLIRRPADAELLPGFLPKRGLQIRLRKGLQVQAHVKNNSNSTHRVPAAI